jgi:hypothetical protein
MVETVMAQEYWEQNYKRSYKKKLVHNMIKKAKAVSFVLLLTCTFLFASGSDFYDETGLIERKGVFYEVENKQYIFTKDGNIWEVVGTNFHNGDRVRVEFFSNWTEDIEDDEITKIHKRWF